MNAATVVRMPPQSVDAERAVLGSVLLSNAALDDALEEMQPEDLYREVHRVVMDAMLALHARREPIDEMTLAEQLRAMGKLDAVNGMAGLVKLRDVTFTAVNVRAHARIVAALAVRRRLMAAAQTILDDAAKTSTDDVPALLDRAQTAVFAIGTKQAHRGPRLVRDVLVDSYKRLEMLASRPNHVTVTGVPTGFAQLDQMTAGLHAGDLFVLAARPGCGKTALAVQLAQHCAATSGPAIVFETEMAAEQLGNRLLASSSGVNLSHIRTGRLNPPEWTSLAEAAGSLSERMLFVDDSGAITVNDIRARCRRIAREHGLSLVVIDYLQRLALQGERGDSRAQIVGAATRAFKNLARELNAPVLLLSQLNRAVDARTDKRPVMSDLRESGEIEQEADVVAFLYRDDINRRDSPDKGTVEIIIGKQRNGPTGTVRLAFLQHLTRFSDLADHDEPPSEPTPKRRRTAQPPPSGATATGESQE